MGHGLPEHKILQIIPAPPWLRSVYVEEDGSLTSEFPLCLALVEAEDPDSGETYRYVDSVEWSADGGTELLMDVKNATWTAVGDASLPH